MPNVPASSAKSVVTLPPGSVDTHAHVFTRELRLAPDPRYVPESGAPIERYLNLLDAHGIAAGILVQPSFLGTDNEYLIAALARACRRVCAAWRWLHPRRRKPHSKSSGRPVSPVSD
jgi:hypothetical protein